MEYEIGPDESVRAAVVRGVSAVEGREPAALGSLEAVLDPGALEGLFTPRADGTARTGGRVSFVYSTCRVTVDNGEYLTVNRLATHSYGASGREPAQSHRR
jgi:hypothetical protein